MINQIQVLKSPYEKKNESISDEYSYNEKEYQVLKYQNVISLMEKGAVNAFDKHATMHYILDKIEPQQKKLIIFADDSASNILTLYEYFQKQKETPKLHNTTIVCAMMLPSTKEEGHNQTLNMVLQKYVYPEPPETFQPLSENNRCILRRTYKFWDYLKNFKSDNEGKNLQNYCFAFDFDATLSLSVGGISSKEENELAGGDDTLKIFSELKEMGAQFLVVTAKKPTEQGVKGLKAELDEIKLKDIFDFDNNIVCEHLKHGDKTFTMCSSCNLLLPAYDKGEGIVSWCKKNGKKDMNIFFFDDSVSNAINTSMTCMQAESKEYIKSCYSSWVDLSYYLRDGILKIAVKNDQDDSLALDLQAPRYTELRNALQKKNSLEFVGDDIFTKNLI